MRKPSNIANGTLIEIGTNAAIDNFGIVSVEAKLLFNYKIISQNYDFEHNIIHK